MNGVERGQRVAVWFGEHAPQEGEVIAVASNRRTVQIKLDSGAYALVHRAYVEPTAADGVGKP